MSFSVENLNKAQKDAVTTAAGNLLILAGPGTGKTRVIVQKILHMVDQGLTPEKILAITFSRKAAQEMEERVLQQRPRLAGQLQILTLHAFCVDLVQKHGFRLGLGRSAKLMTEAQAQLLFRQLAPKLPLDHFMKSSFVDPVIHELFSFFSDAKDEGLWPEDILNYARALPEESEDDQAIKKEWLALGDIYNAFQSQCFENGYLDFGDAVLGAVRILEDFPSVRKQIQTDLSSILVDEFQDTNWTQIRLIRLLANDQCHVVAVGDDDQSIYKFRGACYSAFKFFEEMFPSTKVIELTETYRLPPSVVAVSGALISANEQHRYRPDKKIESKKESDQAVQVVEHSSFEDEAKWLASKISSLMEDKEVSASDIGVLVRAHGHADLFLQEAKKLKLPVQAIATEALFEQDIVRDLMAFLSIIVNPQDSISFLRLLDSAFVRLDADSIFDFCKHVRKEVGSRAYVDLLEKLDESSKLSEQTLSKLKLFYETYKELSVRALREPCSQILLGFYEKTKAVAHLMENDMSALHSLAQFQTQLMEWEAMQPDPSLHNVFPLLHSISTHEISLSKEDTDSNDEKSIKVLSLHASKGLEFKYVFILSLVGRRVPSRFRSHTWLVPDALRKEKRPTLESHLHEERRLLYVGLTRAEENLFLSTIQKKGTKASQFLQTDIPEHLENKSCLVWKIEEQDNTESSIPQALQAFERTKAFTIKTKKRDKPLSLSFTQLDKYERCPRSYWFAYEVKIPINPSASLVVGTSFHEALEAFYKKVKEDEIPSKEELVSSFEKIFSKERKTNIFVTDEHLDLGKKKIAEFYDFQDGKFTKPLALEKAFRLQVGEHQLKGKIDRIDQGSSENSVVIIDYKTGKAKSNQEKEHQKFAKESLQFSIYALASKECFEWSAEELLFYYVYENKTLVTTRSEEDLAKAKTKILELAEGIQNQEFAAKPGFQCKFCEYKEICPSAML